MMESNRKIIVEAEFPMLKQLGKIVKLEESFNKYYVERSGLKSVEIFYDSELGESQEEGGKVYKFNTLIIPQDEAKRKVFEIIVTAFLQDPKETTFKVEINNCVPPSLFVGGWTNERMFVNYKTEEVPKEDELYKLLHYAVFTAVAAYITNIRKMSIGVLPHYYMAAEAIVYLNTGEYKGYTNCESMSNYPTNSSPLDTSKW